MRSKRPGVGAGHPPDFVRRGYLGCRLFFAAVFQKSPSATSFDRQVTHFGLRPKNGRAIPVIGTSRQLLQRDILVAIGCIADIGRHLRGMHRSRLTHQRQWLCTAAMVLMPVCRATSGAVTATCGPCPITNRELIRSLLH